MSNVVFMVVDMQNGLINDHPYNEKNVVSNIKKILEYARKNNKEAIYVRHDDGEGEELTKGNDSWEIYSEIQPEADEKIFDKEYNSAFHGTGLKEYLDSKNIDTIVLMGMQTEYCIDATCKNAFELGYKVIIPEETNTTFDNNYLSGENLYKFINYDIWNGRFAEIMIIDDVIKL